MFEEVYQVAKHSASSWGQKHKVSPSSIPGEYFRVLRAVTEEWLGEDQGLSPQAHQAHIDRLLKLTHEGQLAGIVSAIGAQRQGDHGTVPDHPLAWNWLMESLPQLSESLLWQGYWSAIPEVSQTAISQLRQRARERPGLGNLIALVMDHVNTLSEEGFAVWAELDPPIQWRLWQMVIEDNPAVAALARSLNQTSAPWLTMLIDDLPAKSPLWKPLSVAPVNLTRLYWILAKPSQRMSALQTFLGSSQGRRTLSQLFESEPQMTLSSNERAAWSHAIVEAVRTHREWFDTLALAALRVAPRDFSFPRWFRLMAETNAAVDWQKTVFKPYLTQWHELSLGAFELSARKSLFHGAKDEPAQDHYNQRWLKWYQEEPERAQEEAQRVYWERWRDWEMTPLLLEAVMRCRPIPWPMEQAMARAPLLWWAIFIDIHRKRPMEPATLAALPSVSRLAAAFQGSHQELQHWEHQLILALLGQGIIAAEAVDGALLQQIYLTMAQALSQAWQDFAQQFRDSLSNISKLRHRSSDLDAILSEIDGLYRARFSLPELPLSSDAALARNADALGPDLLVLSLAAESRENQENQMIAEIFSPLAKVFDFALEPVMEDVIAALAPLELSWVESYPGATAFDPAQHEVVGEAIRPESEFLVVAPGLCRRGAVIAKAWGAVIKTAE